MAGNKGGNDSLIQKVVIGVLVAGIAMFGASLAISTIMGNGNDPAQTTGTDEPGGGGDGTATDTNRVPLLTYLTDDEKVARLVQDMKDNNVPTECDVLYDQMGANPSVKLTDEYAIREIYDLVQGITVVKDKEVMPITDSYHHIWFTLQDGTKVGWTFEGAGCLDRGKETLAVEGDEYLWGYVMQLYANGSGYGTSTEPLADGSYPIALSDEYHIVQSCPTSAVPGETVTIVTGDMADAYPVVNVDGGGIEVEQHGTSFSFVMPDHQVYVRASYSTYGIGGA